MRDLEDPNILRIEGQHSLEKSNHDSEIQIRCPHCQSIGTFAPAVGQFVRYYKSIHNLSVQYARRVDVHIRMCPNKQCRGIIFTATSADDEGVETLCFPSEKLDFDPESIPNNLKTTLEEAIICHSQGAYRACAMMVRRLLEELCDDCGATGKTLHLRLKGLRTQITLSEELFDAMDELKALGNDAAHIEAKAFANIDKEEAELSIELAQEILKARYQHKSLVDRLRSRKKRPSK